MVVAEPASKDCAAWKQDADEAFLAGRYGIALLAYSHAIAVHDGDRLSLAALYSNRAAAYTQQGSFAAALADGQHACRLRPQWGTGYYRQVVALVGLHRYDEAWTIRQQGLQMDPAHEGLLEAEAAIPAAHRSMQPSAAPAGTQPSAIHDRQSGAKRQHISQPTVHDALADASAQADRPPLKQARVVSSAQPAASSPIRPPGLDDQDSSAAEAVEADMRATQAGVPLPVTVVSGFLGAGKTTLLNRILQNQAGLKVAVIVNDMAEVNIDAQLLAGSPSKQLNPSRSIVELTNGCICCTLREDLLQEVAKLLEQGSFDYLIIESTGISEPMPVAATLEGMSPELAKQVRIDTMVTVADSQRLLADLDSGDLLADRGAAVHAEDGRSVAQLIVDQLEFADVVVLNKCDLVPAKEELARLEACIARLNPRARVVRSTFCDVPWQEVVQTHRFDPEQAWETAGWQQELLGTAHAPETQEYGICSFVYRASIPFHPGRLWACAMEADPALPPCLRSKGFFWLAARPQLVWEWSTAGASRTFKPYGLWKPVEDGRATSRVRKQELVFIGVHLDEAGIRHVLDACLLSPEELAQGEASWQAWSCPWDMLQSSGCGG